MAGILKALVLAAALGLGACAATNTGPGFEQHPVVEPAWKVGDEVEYKVTDLFTNTSRNVVYRIDRVEKGRLVINQGGRVEAPSGEVISIASGFSGGDMERLSPPGGWGRGAAAPPGTRWAVRHAGPGGNDYTKSWLNLHATVIGRSKVGTPAGSFEVVQVRYTGWVTFTRGTGSLVAQVRQLEVAYAPSLGRVVRFQSELQKNGGNTTENVSSKERTELVAVRRS